MTNVVTLGTKKAPESSSALTDHRLSESATAELRWRNGHLEQMWMVFDWSETAKKEGNCGEIPHKKEWRVVPTVS